MFHRVLADLVLATHLAFIIFVVLGALLTLRWWWVPLAHVPSALWGVYIELSGGTCPLTPLENSLRRAAGGAGYTESFVERYVLSLVYPAALTPPIQLVLTMGLLLANVALYSVVIWRRSSARGRRPAA